MKAQRHNESRHQRSLMPAFIVPLCLRAFVFTSHCYNFQMNPSEHLAQLGRDFHRRGWALGTSGNFSAVVSRSPLRLAITASSLDKGTLTPEQILEVDAEGKVLTAAGGQPSAETLLHIAIVHG